MRDFGIMGGKKHLSTDRSLPMNQEKFREQWACTQAYMRDGHKILTLSESKKGQLRKMPKEDSQNLSASKVREVSRTTSCLSMLEITFMQRSFNSKVLKYV